MILIRKVVTVLGALLLLSGVVSCATTDQNDGQTEGSYAGGPGVDGGHMHQNKK
jgi:hypothetical protein